MTEYVYVPMEARVVEEFGVAVMVDEEPSDEEYNRIFDFCRKKAIDRMTNRQRKSWAKAGYPHDITPFVPIYNRVGDIPRNGLT